jgi:hypothetical protein
MKANNAGYLVITKAGKHGRTFHSKGLIKDKVPVYLEREGQPHCYEDKAILCDPKTLQTVGFTD